MKIIIETDGIINIRACQSFLKLELKMTEYQIKQAIKELEKQLKKQVS